MDIKEVFGNNLRNIRKKKGFTQEQLAEFLDISLNHLANVETGKTFVSAELLMVISKKMKVSPASLFYSPEFISSDDTTLTKVDRIIEEQCKIMKSLIRENFESGKHR
jgi:putative transcriptional regulator